MERADATQHPVLHYLAVARAARDFGLDRDELDRLAAGFTPHASSVEELAEAIADALLAQR